MYVRKRYNTQTFEYSHVSLHFKIKCWAVSPLEASYRTVSTKNPHPTCTPERVPSPIHDSCTACIVRVAMATSAMTSDSTAEHPVDSSWCPPNAHEIETRECCTPSPKSKKAVAKNGLWGGWIWIFNYCWEVIPIYTRISSRDYLQNSLSWFIYTRIFSLNSIVFQYTPESFLWTTHKRLCVFSLLIIPIYTIYILS